jgi:putative AlgH/UPF0301 family transcriptional regulator
MAIEQQDPQVPSIRGQLLVASPHADASPYRRAVVLLMEHNEEGTAGIVLDDQFRRSLVELRGNLPQMTSDRVGKLGSIPVRLANWEPGQLEVEVNNGLWLSLPSDMEQILNDGLPKWSDLVRAVGRSVYREALGIEHFPSNPHFN